MHCISVIERKEFDFLLFFSCIFKLKAINFDSWSKKKTIWGFLNYKPISKKHFLQACLLDFTLEWSRHSFHLGNRAKISHMNRKYDKFHSANQASQVTGLI